MDSFFASVEVREKPELKGLKITVSLVDIQHIKQHRPAVSKRILAYSWENFISEILIPKSRIQTVTQPR
jgi:hypothetical protein